MIWALRRGRFASSRRGYQCAAARTVRLPRSKPVRVPYCRKVLMLMVGAEGFEPPALCSQSRCATRLRYAPIFSFDCSAKWFPLEGGWQALRADRPSRQPHHPYDANKTDQIAESGQPKPKMPTFTRWGIQTRPDSRLRHEHRSWSAWSASPSSIRLSRADRENRNRLGRVRRFNATIDVCGGSSSVAERLTVAQDVVGSIPTRRPIIESIT